MGKRGKDGGRERESKKDYMNQNIKLGSTSLANVSEHKIYQASKITSYRKPLFQMQHPCMQV